MSLEKMQSIVREQMTLIDEILSKRGTSLTQRPFEAASLFVNECIVEIEGDTKDDYWGKKWFADIYRWTEEWYRERYGDALKNEGKDNAKGITLVYGTPFPLDIPLTLTKPEEPGKTVWLIFPIEVMPEEDPVNWLQPKPNLQQLSEKQLTQLTEEIGFVASALRAINVNLMTAEYPSSSLQMLAGGITAHLKKAVQDILSGKPEQISVAYWEIHLAIEKTVKVFLKQKGQNPPNIHDLAKLREMADLIINSTELNDCFEQCPSDKEAIKYRYGESDKVSSETAIQFYFNSLRIIVFYTKELHRKYIMNNARFLIKSPPWQESNS